MTSPERVVEHTRSFLERHPEAEGALRAIIAMDEAGVWTFEDIDLDSGRFGTLVSEGIVEHEGDAYRLAHREAVERALDGESWSDEEAAVLDVAMSLPTIDPTVALGLVGVSALMAITRSLRFGEVFQRGRVVSPGNDPYFYRWMQYELLDLSSSPFDLMPVTDMPARAASRPFTHAMNWWFATLLGGTNGAADTVAAWLPIVGAIALGLVLYLIARRLTGDVRIALVSVAFLAVIPVHAFYTGLGFLEHRVHQYLWLGVLTLGLVWPAVDLHRRVARVEPSLAVADHLRERSTWIAAGVLAVAVVPSVYAWRGSALTFVPVGLFLGLKSVLDVRQDLSPSRASLPLLVGMGLGSVLTFVPYAWWGWHRGDTFLVLAPGLVVVGGLVFVGLAEAWRRTDLHLGGLVVVHAVAALLGLFAFRVAMPAEFGRALDRSGDLLFREDIVEVVSLFSIEHASLFGPLYQLGLVFYLGLPAMVWITWQVYRRYEPAWLVPVVFGWYYLVLAGFQMRFAGQLSMFIALFVGVLFVWFLAWIDLAERPALFADDAAVERPMGRGQANGPSSISLDIERGKLVAVALVVGVLLLMNAGLAYGLFGPASHGDRFDAVLAIEEDVDEVDSGQPYVLSSWGFNRMYNFFISGEASGYGFAQANYPRFIAAEHPDDAYAQFADEIGYIVVDDFTMTGGTTGRVLYEDLGAGTDPVSHLRLIHVGDGVRTFALVEGAELVLSTELDSVTIHTEVTVDGTVVTYERTVPIEDGQASVRVPYPGTYDIADETFMVSEAAVRNGESIEVDLEG